MFPAERQAVLAAKAGTASSTPLVTSYVSAANAQKLLAVAVLGDMASETIDVAIYQATDASGTSAKSAKAATQLSAHASNNDNKVILIQLDPADLDLDYGFTFVAVRCVTGNTVGGAVGLVLLGDGLRYGPGSLVDNAAVVEIKT